MPQIGHDSLNLLCGSKYKEQNQVDFLNINFDRSISTIDRVPKNETRKELDKIFEKEKKVLYSAFLETL